MRFSNEVRAQTWLGNELGLIERGEWTPRPGAHPGIGLRTRPRFSERTDKVHSSDASGEGNHFGCRSWAVLVDFFVLRIVWAVVGPPRGVGEHAAQPTDPSSRCPGHGCRQAPRRREAIRNRSRGGAEEAGPSRPSNVTGTHSAAHSRRPPTRPVRGWRRRRAKSAPAAGPRRRRPVSRSRPGPGWGSHPG